MVGVHEDTRRPCGSFLVRDDGRAAALGDDLDVHPLGLEQLRDGARGVVDVLLVERSEGDAGDAREGLEVLDDAGHEGGDALAEILRGARVHGGSHSRHGIPRAPASGMGGARA